MHFQTSPDVLTEPAQKDFAEEIDVYLAAGSAERYQCHTSAFGTADSPSSSVTESKKEEVRVAQRRRTREIITVYRDTHSKKTGMN